MFSTAGGGEQLLMMCNDAACQLGCGTFCSKADLTHLASLPIPWMNTGVFAQQVSTVLNYFDVCTLSDTSYSTGKAALYKPYLCQADLCIRPEMSQILQTN